jgi:MFS family permease
MSPDPSGLADQLAAFNPATSQIPAIGLIVLGLSCGVILWLFGHKVLGPVVFILGGAIGAAAGMVAPQHLAIDSIGGYPASLVGLIIGAVLGGLLAGALYRTAITLGSGLSFAAAGLITGLAVWAPPPTPAPDATPAIAQVEPEPAADLQPMDALPDSVGEEDQPAAEASDLADAAQRAVTFVKSSAVAVQDQWFALDENGRLRVAGATIGGLMLGLLIGLIAHQRASAIVTSAVGSGVSLYCVAWLGTQSPMPWTSITAGFGPSEWVMTWGAAAVIGIIFQGLFIRPRSAPRPTPAPAAEKAEH